MFFHQEAGLRGWLCASPGPGPEEIPKHTNDERRLVDDEIPLPMLLSHKNGKHVEPHLYRRHWLGKHRLDQRFGPYWMSEARFGLVYILFQSVSDFFRFAR